jgi:hypothetical protein
MATPIKHIHPSRNDKSADSGDAGVHMSDERNDADRPIWEIIVEIGSHIPLEEWAKTPDDASINYKHYLYDAPKKNA